MTRFLLFGGGGEGDAGFRVSFWPAGSISFAVGGGVSLRLFKPQQGCVPQGTAGPSLASSTDAATTTSSLACA